MIKKRKLVLKTFLHLLSMLMILLVVIHMIIFFTLPRIYQKEAQQEMEFYMLDLTEILSPLNIDKINELLASYAIRNNLNISIHYKEETNFYHGFSPMVEYFFETDEELTVKGVEGTETLLIRHLNITSNDDVDVSIQVVMNTQPLKDAEKATFSLIPYSLTLSLFIAFIFSYGYSKKITRPILNIVDGIKPMARLEKEASLTVTSKDEIGLLASQINHVYQQIWILLDEREKEKIKMMEVEKSKIDFLRSASHELKTPLAKMQILLENMLFNIGKYKDHETYLRECIKIIDHLSYMIKELLDHSDLKEQPINRINMKDKIEYIFNQYSEIIHQKNILVDILIDESLAVKMTDSDFNTIFSNLISNAVYYSNINGTIKVSITNTSISIYNTCNPLLENEIPHLFEAFKRLDSSQYQRKKGNGLGLYFVKNILDSLELFYRFLPDKDGMCFVIDLDHKIEKI